MERNRCSKMSISYDVGFTRKPELAELDGFLASLGFEIEPPGQRSGKFTQVYVFCDDSVPREIEFFYEDEVGEGEVGKERQDWLGEKGKDVLAYGCLKTYSLN